MARFTVGGRPFEHDKEAVERRMRDIDPEPVREHLVEIGGRKFPPKQVIAVLTGWERQSYTTMEAQRVLTSVGFRCRRVGSEPVEAGSGENGNAAVRERVSRLEAAVIVLQEAVSSLSRRVSDLEGEG